MSHGVLDNQACTNDHLTTETTMYICHMVCYTTKPVLTTTWLQRPLYTYVTRYVIQPSLYYRPPDYRDHYVHMSHGMLYNQACTNDHLTTETTMYIRHMVCYTTKPVLTTTWLQRPLYTLSSYWVFDIFWPIYIYCCLVLFMLFLHV